MDLQQLKALIETAGDRSMAELAYLAAARSRSLPDYARDKWQRNESKGKGAAR